MHVETILPELLETSIHKTRIKTLILMVKGLIECKTMQLTTLGRTLEIDGTEKAGIKRTNRLLANEYYQTKSMDIYRAIAKKAVEGLENPTLIVDWSSIPGSHLSPHGEQCILRAGLAAVGRSITLYEEVHPKKQENNDRVHRAFLAKLKSLLPSNCKPCVLTDAGFKNPWFKAVAALDWNFVGRISGLVQYDNGAGFKPISELFDKASSKPQAFGEVQVAKTNPLLMHLFLYKTLPKNRKHKTKTGKIDRSKQSRKQAKSNSQPWILVSSLKGDYIEQKIIKLYKMRMSIEESFRDTKSSRYGLSMNDNNTIKKQRYIVWLLLAALASFVAWIVGYKAEQLRLHHDFQANSYKHRRVLSFFYLGCQIIRKNIELTIRLHEINGELWGETL